MPSGDQLVTEFERAHPRSVRALAVHAALPAAINPELLHHIRDNFLLDSPGMERLAVTAESELLMARLLLSPLFRQIDDELFEMVPDVRRVLLNELERLDGGRRIAEVATLLERYTVEASPWQDRPELEWAQRVSARVAEDPRLIEDWLAEGARGGGSAELDERWFAAMRERIAQDRTVAAGADGGTALAEEAVRGAVVVLTSGRSSGCAVRLLANGLLVTPAHVVGSSASSRSVWRAVPLGAHDMDGNPASVIAVDSERGIAFLREERSAPGPTCRLGDDEDVEPGVSVTAVGTTAERAEERSEQRLWQLRIELVDPPVIVTSSALGPGSAGSPLVDPHGIVVALHTTRRDDGRGEALLAGMIVASMADSLEPGELAMARTPADVELVVRVAESASARDVAVRLADVAVEVAFELDDTTSIIRALVARAGAAVRDDAPEAARSSLAEAVALVEARTEQSDPRREFVVRATERLLGPDGLSSVVGEPPIGFAEANVQLKPERSALPPEFTELASRFDRGLQPTARQQAAAATDVLDAMVVAARRIIAGDPQWRDLLAAMTSSPSAGMRLLAVVLLQVEADAAWLDWLSQHISPSNEHAFVAYEAAAALRSAAESLPLEHLDEVERALDASMTIDVQRRSAAVLQRARAVVTARRRQPPPSSTEHVISADWKLWRDHSVLRVAFLGGTREYQDAVSSLARQWTEGTGISLDFVPAGAATTAELRVALTSGEGSWSYRGTDALVVSGGEPTMTIDTSVALSHPWFRKQVLSEFGQALGLVAEHQQPHAALPWDRDAVYRVFAGPPNHWTREMVDHNILSRYDFRSPPEYRPFDLHSVMLHELPRELFEGGAFKVPINYELSSSDRAFISRLYPPRPARKADGRANVAQSTQTRYEFSERLLESGPLGSLLVARDTRLDRAVDILHVESAHRDRVQQLVDLSSGIRDSAAIAVHDVLRAGPAGALESVALEHVVGQVLTHVLEGGRALPWQDVGRIGAIAARTLAAVHATGVAHGGVTPSMIVLADDAVRIRLVNPDAGILGPDSPYAAPELAGDARPTAAADVFSLARVVLAGVIGRPLRRGEVAASSIPSPLRRPLADALRSTAKVRPSAAELGALLSKAASQRGASSKR